MPEIPRTPDVSWIAKIRTGVGGLTAIFCTAMLTIIALIFNKPHFSEDLFLLALVGILIAGAGATLYLFCYGVGVRILKSADMLQQQTMELSKERLCMSELLLKKMEALSQLQRGLPSPKDEDDEAAKR